MWIDDCAEQFVKKKKKVKCLEYTEALKTFMKNVMPRCNAKM